MCRLSRATVDLLFPVMGSLPWCRSARHGWWLTMLTQSYQAKEANCALLMNHPFAWLKYLKTRHHPCVRFSLASESEDSHKNNTLLCGLDKRHTRQFVHSFRIRFRNSSWLSPRSVRNHMPSVASAVFKSCQHKHATTSREYTYGI